MKKLICAAAMSALCATVFAIESENIVGYQQIEIPAGYSMYCVTFKDVTGGAYDFTDVKLLNSAGLEMNDDKTVTPSRQSRNKVLIQKLDLASGSLKATTYKYNSQNGKGWCEGSTSLAEGAVTFQNGEGIYISNNQGTTVKLQCSGSVELRPVSMALAPGYSIVGNMCPVAVDLKSIKLLNSDGLEMNDDKTVTPSRQSRNKILVQFLSAENGSLESTTYKYNSQNGKGWCRGSTQLEENEVVLQPGESFYLNNSQGDTVYLQFPTLLN